MQKQYNILVVGCGAMGSAIINGWHQDQHLNFAVSIVTPHQSSLDRSMDPQKVQWYDNPAAVLEPQDFILFAVKPNLLTSLLPQYAQYAKDWKSCVLSVAAGKALRFYEGLLPNKTPVIRTMPNTPSAIGQGITLMLANQWVGESNRSVAEHMMKCIGSIQWVADDTTLDKCAALTSCGPAYIFQFVESLTDVGTQFLNISHDEALILAKDLVVGSVHYMQESKKSPSSLREAVTSKGGMTQAALDVLRSEHGLSELMHKAVEMAFIRAIEMRDADDK